VDKRQPVTAAARRSTLTRREVDEALDAILETVTEVVAAVELLIHKDFRRFTTWQCRQHVRGLDGQVCEVDGAQLAFNASTVLRRRLK
jgi:nucleoid DNA-binding protein